MGEGAPRGRRGLRWTLLAAAAGVAAAALVNIAAALGLGLLPDSWTWVDNAWVAGPVTVGLVLSAVALQASAEKLSGPSDGTALVVGPIPGPAADLVTRSELDELAAVLSSAADSTITCVLRGGPGTGKSQLAAAYTRARIGDGRLLVGWVPADTQDELIAGMAAVAEKVGVADPEGDSERSAARLRDHLATREAESLLVFDNATHDAIGRLRSMLPSTGRARLVIATNSDVYDQMGHVIQVGSFDREQAVTYLKQRTGLDDSDGADEVAQLLGRLPVGLAQAAAVISGPPVISYSDYLRRLHTLTVAQMLPHNPADPYPHGVADAILLAVQSAEDGQADGLVRKILETVALLSPAGIEQQTLRDIVLDRDSEDSLSAAEVARFDWTLQLVTRASLLTWSDTTRSVAAHSLVARVLRDRAREAAELSGLIMSTAEQLWPLLPPEQDAWAQRDQAVNLAAHAQALWEHAIHAIDVHAMTADGLTACAKLAHWAVRHLTASADLARAAHLGEVVQADCVRILGTDHPDTLISRNNLANAYNYAGRHDEAIDMLEQTLTDRERVLGTDHPDTLTSRNNLANAYDDAGRYVEAIDMLEQTLTDRERVLGADHPDTLNSRNNLAAANHDAGRHVEAIDIFEQTLTHRERDFGADHPDTLNSRNSLAAAYSYAGRHDAAIDMLEQILTDRERVLGADHPETLTSRSNLAAAIAAAGRYDEAIDMLEQILTERERVLGADHPETLTSRNNLAVAYLDAGQHADAISLHEQTLTDRERVLGTDHPDTLNSRNNLANAYRAVGRLDDAVSLHEQTLTNFERVLGTDHPDTLNSRNNLANAWHNAGLQDDAILMLQHALADAERVLNPEHPLTMRIRANLAEMLRAQGHPDFRGWPGIG